MERLELYVCAIVRNCPNAQVIFLEIIKKPKVSTGCIKHFVRVYITEKRIFKIRAIIKSIRNIKRRTCTYINDSAVRGVP